MRYLFLSAFVFNLTWNGVVPEVRIHDPNKCLANVLNRNWFLCKTVIKKQNILLEPGMASLHGVRS